MGKKEKEEKEEKSEKQRGCFYEKSKGIKKNTLLWLILFFINLLAAEATTIKVVGGFFFPTDDSFKEIYGKGTTSGFELTASLYKNLEFWARVTYFFRRGHLTLTREDTQVEIIPFSYGLKASLRKGFLSLYGGIGLNYYLFNEVNPLGNIDWGDLGYSLRAGIISDIWKKILIETYVDYSSCSIMPADYKVNIGGWHIMLCLGYKF